MSQRSALLTYMFFLASLLPTEILGSSLRPERLSAEQVLEYGSAFAFLGQCQQQDFAASQTLSKLSGDFQAHFGDEWDLIAEAITVAIAKSNAPNERPLYVGGGWGNTPLNDQTCHVVQVTLSNGLKMLRRRF